jgi:ribosomal-protein-alanine N-acetyltransferase
MFNQLQLHRVMATYMTANQRSAALLKRLGFEKEGYAKSYMNISGTWEDHILTALVNPSH